MKVRQKWDSLLMHFQDRKVVCFSQEEVMGNCKDAGEIRMLVESHDGRRK